MGRTAVAAAGIWLLLLAFAPGVLAEDARDHPTRVVHRVHPIYPEIARRLSLEGSVLMRAEVAADGHVKSVTVVSGNAILAQAAVRAVREWVFAPGGEESVPVGVNFIRGQ